MTDSPLWICRAEAGSAIGVGHVMRSLTLARAAKAAGFDCELHTQDIPSELRDQAMAAGVRVVDVPCEVGSTEDARVLASHGQAVTCVDGYWVSRSYVDSLASSAGTVVVIDDTGALDGSAFDLLLNQNPYASETMYPESPPNRLLLGLGYALIRPEVARHVGAARPTGQSLEVVVALGGTDVAGLGPTLCDALASIEGVSVSLASGFGTWMPTAEQADDDDRVVALIPSANLPAVLARSDLAVVAAGSTVWEVAALGVPTVALVVADNQAPLLDDPVVANMAEVIDARGALDLNSFVGVVQGIINDGQLRGCMASAGSNLVDGKGVDRVVAATLSVHDSSRSTSEGRR